MHTGVLSTSQLPSLLRDASAADGVSEVRVLSTRPWFVFLVDAPLAPARAEVLSDRLSALAGVQIEVRRLVSLRPWRRGAAWRSATPL
jgi:hypothetical protein